MTGVQTCALPISDSIKITQDENNVYFELADGTVITISKTGQSADPNVIQFEDEAVKAICVGYWDFDNDGELSYNEAAKVTDITNVFRGTNISTFNEFQYFTGLTEVSKYTFTGCEDLIRIIIPQNVNIIDEHAFANCTNLARITLNTSLTTIGIYAFGNCSSLKTITIPSSVTTIRGSAFYLCKILSTIYCTPTTPPTGLDNYTFETTCKIYVPLSAVSSYKYRESWSKYASQIEGYDFE